MEGSLTTIPFPRANTSVFAVPRSMARSEDMRLNTDRILNPFLLTKCVPLRMSAAAPATVRRERLVQVLLPRTLVAFDERSELLRNHHIHALDRRAAPPVLAGDHNSMAAPRHGIG